MSTVRSQDSGYPSESDAEWSIGGGGGASGVLQCSIPC